MGRTDIIKVKSSILIMAPCAQVFEYVSDYTNDCNWRNEIKSVQINTPNIVVGTSINEESFLSKRVPEHLNQLICTHLDKNKMIEAETKEGSQFWQKNSRSVKSLSVNVTQLEYHIQFDTAVVQYGLGFRLPKFMINYYTKMTMKKYLAKLKSILEVNYN